MTFLQVSVVEWGKDNDDDNDLNQHDVDILCDASEDYEAHKDQCDKLYDQVRDDDN
jgi:hypothetical protein